MNVQDLMTRDVVTCRPDDDLSHLGSLMSAMDCGSIPVCTGRLELVGILTDRDVCIYLAKHDVKPSDVKVREVMRHEVWYCGPGDAVRTALAMMERHGVRRLPVVDDQKQVLGILSIDDVAAEAKAIGLKPFDAPLFADVARTLRAVSAPHLHNRLA